MYRRTSFLFYQKSVFFKIRVVENLRSLLIPLMNFSQPFLSLMRPAVQMVMKGRVKLITSRVNFHISKEKTHLIIALSSLYE